jgi:hypothetical protein
VNDSAVHALVPNNRFSANLTARLDAGLAGSSCASRHPEAEMSRPNRSIDFI